jgi:glycosyltransferase involved in cell wall biosynthesis
VPKVVALVSAVNPFPTDAGKKVVLAGFLKYLNARVGPSNVHYLMVSGSTVSAFPGTVHHLPKPDAVSAVRRVLTHTASGRSSLQEALLGTEELRQAVARILRAVSPDLEIYDTVRMAQHATTRAVAKMCYLDDLFSERYGAMLEAATRYPDVDLRPLGNFAAHVPSALRPFADHPYSQRMLLRLERELVRHSEDRVVNRFDRTILISGKEAESLRQRCDASVDRVQSVPPLISKPSNERRAYGGGPQFVFLGLLSLPHNDDGLRMFLADVWPRVLQRLPGAELRVVGRHPRRLLRDRAARHADSVTLEGFVPELDAVLSRAAAMVNPLRFGSGVKLKIIEALGAGLPVVSTRIGADGLSVGAEYGILCADQADQFADALAETTHPVRNRELSEAARAHFASTFSRDAVFAKYDAVFGFG